MITKIITCYLLVLLSVFASAQDAKSLEGYYNLSQQEAPTHLYLLDDNTFYYYSIFGSVDLEIYGTYTIKENQLQFYPREDQLQSYVLYGRANEALKDSIAFNYMQNEQDHRTQLVLGIENEWYKRAMAKINEDEIYYRVNKKQVTKLEIGYPAHFDGAGNFIQVAKIGAAQIPEGMNDFLLPHNRFATMRSRFSKIPMQLKGDAIVDGEETILREDLKEGENKEIAAFLKTRQMFAPTTESRGNIFKRIALVNKDKSIKLKRNAKGQWLEMQTYNEDGDKVKNGSYYDDKGKLKEIIIEHPNSIDGENIMYYKNGELVGISKPDGENNLYYENGQLRILRNFLNEVEVGKWQSFYPNGKVRETGAYKDGIKIGEWKTYDVNGELLETEKF